MAKENPKVNVDEVELVRRISPALIAGSLRAQKIEKKTLAGKVAGIVEATRVNESSIGQVSTQLLGEFLVRCHDGRMLKSATLYLPEYFAKELGKAVSETKGKVQFAGILYICPSTSPVGYSWEFESPTKFRSLNEDLSRLMPD